MRCNRAALLEKCACAVAASSTLVDDEFDLIATGKRERHRVDHSPAGKGRRRRPFESIEYSLPFRPITLKRRL